MSIRCLSSTVRSTFRLSRPVLQSSRRHYQERPDAAGKIGVTEPSAGRSQKMVLGLVAFTVAGVGMWYGYSAGWQGKMAVEDPRKDAGGASG